MTTKKTQTEKPQAHVGGAVAQAAVEKLQDPDKGYAEIAEEIREEIPGARTTGQSVASQASNARSRGVDIPARSAEAEPGSNRGQEYHGEETRGPGRDQGPNTLKHK